MRTTRLSEGVACGRVAKRLRQASPEADELSAKLVALRRWLKEFTHLDEAIPRDVALWDRLLVMAVAPGVSDEGQLKVAAAFAAEAVSAPSSQTLAYMP